VSHVTSINPSLSLGVMSHTASVNTKSRYTSAHANECYRGWLRLVGSLKSHVTFLQKSPIKGTILSEETYKLKDPTNRSNPISSSRVHACCVRHDSQRTHATEFCHVYKYGVATISRLLKMIGLFGRI